MTNTTKIPTETPESKCVLTNLMTLVSLENQRHNDFKESDEYKQSAFIQKLRQKDRDRQADGEYNSKRREQYAFMIEAINGREVRQYTSGLTGSAKRDHDRQQTAHRVSKHRAALSEEQRAERRKKDAERKKLARDAKKAELAAQRDEGRGIF